MTARVRSLAIFFSLGATAFAATVEEVAPRRGALAAPIVFRDDNGSERKLSDLAGYPVVLLPIYTRCRTACVQNIAQLKKAMADVGADPRGFRVLLFSFDPADDAATLARYRKREAIPLAWLIGGADEANISALLESVGFQAGRAGREFTHPNVLIFLDSNLRVAKWIYGTNYTSLQMSQALQVATGKSDWRGRYGDALYCLAILVGVCSCVAFFQHMTDKDGSTAL